MELGPSLFWSKFLASCYGRSSLHEFLCFFRRTTLHMAQSRCMGRAWYNLDFLSNFLKSCFYRSVLHKFL